MLSAVQKKKFTTFFNHIDLNNDGIYEKADAEEYAHRLREFLNLKPDDPEYELVRQGTVGSREMAAYADFYKEKGQRLSLADYLELMDILVHDAETFGIHRKNQIRMIWGLWDQDEDDRLSKDEYLQLGWCYGINEEAAEIAFEHLDLDDDGYITRSEMLKAVEEFYLSDDPDAPGNWLLGPY